MRNMGIQLRTGIFILLTLAAIFFFLWVKVGGNRLGEMVTISFSSNRYAQYLAGRR